MEEFYAAMDTYLQIPRTKAEIEHEKKRLVRHLKLGVVPSDIDISLRVSPAAKQHLQTKPTRTIAGVVPIAVMTSPWGCPHGRCTFCPGGLGSPFGDVPQSYTGKEPSTMRAMRHAYDAFLIVFNRLEQYVAMNHSPEKVELIVMGGTFTARPVKYQTEFLHDCYAAMNAFGKLFFPDGNIDQQRFQEFFEIPGNFKDEDRVRRVQERIRQVKAQHATTTLADEQVTNESAVVRCIGITVETKPDWGKLEQGNRMLEQGVTKVEIGIQSVYGHVLAATHRGHTVQDNVESLAILKDLGFKINCHYMIGLPETSRDADVAGLRELFTNSVYRPDLLKIYPCSVAKGTPLYNDWKAGTFTAMTTEEAASMLAEWMPHVPTYCRIVRILRDVPTKQWEAGVGITNLRQYIDQKYAPKCRCIRCREPKSRVVSWDDVHYQTLEYDANGGKEFFISADDTKNDILIGFCRLRFPGQFLRPEITRDAAILRELHVYGAATSLGKTGPTQHRGVGKQLLQLAEQIARAHDKRKIVVISGVGVRAYYQKLGYQKEGPYVVKSI